MKELALSSLAAAFPRYFQITIWRPCAQNEMGIEIVRLA
jgi:hypothetical protein